MPALRRPCIPSVTDEASRSARTISAGKVAARVSALSESLAIYSSVRHSRSITVVTVRPSARAAKLSAMR